MDIKINEREITAIIGPSGCGKSTFIRSINRMNDLVMGCTVKGTVNVDGKDIYGKGVDAVEVQEAHRHGVPEAQPLPQVHIREHRLRPPSARFRRTRRGSISSYNKQQLKDIVEWSLKRAALWEEVSDRLDKSAYNLSGGQQQRLCIARALAIKPEIILFDEPCSALDPIATAKIEDLLIDLKKDYTVLIVTHNMQQAARVADRTAYFYLGELIEFGETKQIFEKPEKDLTEQYITGRMG